VAQNKFSTILQRKVQTADRLAVQHTFISSWTMKAQEVAVMEEEREVTEMQPIVDTEETASAVDEVSAVDDFSPTASDFEL